MNFKFSLHFTLIQVHTQVPNIRGKNHKLYWNIFWKDDQLLNDKNRLNCVWYLADHQCILINRSL